MGRHKRSRVRDALAKHYYNDRTGIWPRIRARVERNGGVEGTKLDIMWLMVVVLALGIVAVAVWMAVSGTLFWP